MIQKYLALLVCALAHISTFAEGFLAGTFVKTPSGYTEIEQLRVGDEIVCYDFKGECVTRSVTHIQQEQVEAYARITVGSEQIFASLDHKFYIPSDNAFVEAFKIQPGSFFLKNCIDTIAIDSLQVVEATAVAYDITVDEYHNFCVSREDVCVHNVLPVVAGITLSWFWGAGVIPVITGMVGIGAFIGKAIFEGAAAPRNFQLDFDVDRFGEQFNNPRRYQMAGHEDDDLDNIAARDPWDKKKPKKEHAEKKLGIAVGGSGASPSPSSNGRRDSTARPPEDPEWKKNEMHRSEFFKKIKKDYTHWRDGIYKRNKGSEGVHKAEYIEWDNLHQDVELYNRGGEHLGSLDPAKQVLYKLAKRHKLDL